MASRVRQDQKSASHTDIELEVIKKQTPVKSKRVIKNKKSIENKHSIKDKWPVKSKQSIPDKEPAKKISENVKKEMIEIN